MLEERFLALCEEAKVPKPEVNAQVEGIEVDFHWRAQRLIVETDGYATHGTRSGFARDRERDRRLLIAGWRVMRFTWREVVRSPTEVPGTLQVLL